MVASNLLSSCLCLPRARITGLGQQFSSLSKNQPFTCSWWHMPVSSILEAEQGEQEFEVKDWIYSSVLERLSSIYNALGSVPSIIRKK
jgi:hypothetical protein